MAVTCFPQVTAMLVELNPQLFLRGVDENHLESEKFSENTPM